MAVEQDVGGATDQVITGRHATTRSPSLAYSTDGEEGGYRFSPGETNLVNYCSHLITGSISG